MSTTVFLAVLAAAALHALWNALAKGGHDKHLSMTAVVLGHTPIALAALAYAPMPAPESWPYLAVGMFLHTGYQLFLLSAYRLGDLTQVYPIARGTAPLLVAGVSTVFLGVHLQPIELMAILTIAAGILSLALVRRQDGSRNGLASLLAFITGCFIASYSLVDGTAARMAGTAVGAYAWIALGNSVLIAAYFAIVKPGLLRRLPEAKSTFLLAAQPRFSPMDW